MDTEQFGLLRSYSAVLTEVLAVAGNRPRRNGD